MLNPFIELINTVLTLYSYVLWVWVILSVLISFEIVNRRQQLVWRAEYALNKLVEPALKPIRKYMPDLGGVDISPIVLILMIGFLQSAMFHYLYNL